MLFFSGATLSAAIACGGPKTPVDATKADGGPATPPSSATAPVDDAGPTTTTTDTLGDAGSGQKLPPVASTASAPADAGRGDGGEHTADPGRSAKDIEAMVKSHRDEARKCYDDALKDHPGIEGDLVITWKVGADGAITKIDVNAARSTITEPSVVSCVIGVIKRIKFAPSPRGYESTYNYPFNFHPRGPR